jgi:hypothetical protein
MTTTGSGKASALLVAGVALTFAACGASYRQVRLSEPAIATAEGLRVEVERVFLTEEVIVDGVGDGAALVLELTAENSGSGSYSVKASALSCLMGRDVDRPGETLLLAPSVNGEGAFPGAAPEETELTTIEVPSGQTRSFWVMFRGYRFPDSDIPRRITLEMPGADGQTLRLVLADPARGSLRWNVGPTNSAWTIGFQDESLYSSYLRATAVSTRFARISRAGPLLWNVGLTSTLLVQTQGALRSPTSSFSSVGLEASVTAPIRQWGAALDPRRLGLYAGAQAEVLVALEPSRPAGDTTLPSIYGGFEPEVGLELDIGALRTAATPFPLSNAGRNPLPRWLLRYGYTHAWFGHGTTDGIVSSFRLIW